MIRLIMTNLSKGTTLDLTDRIRNAGRFVITDERERKSFQRVAGDLSVTLSNIDGVLTSTFEAEAPQTRWEITVLHDAVIKWRGEVDVEALDFSIGSKWLDLTAWSKNRVFWDRARQATIWDVNSRLGGRNIVTDLLVSPTIALDELLRGQFDYLSLLDDPSIAIWDGDLGGYEERQILLRGSGTTASGYWGRYVDLMPDTTVYELLSAMAIYYNAEFFIEPATKAFHMRQRGTTNGTVKYIDQYLIASQEPRVRWVDENKQDYLKVLTVLEYPPPSVYSLNSGGDLVGGRHDYLILGIVDGVGRMLSEMLSVDMPLVWSINGQSATISLPRYPEECTTKQLYRRSVASGVFHLVGETENTQTVETTLVTDRLSEGILALRDALPTTDITRYPVYAYHSYNDVDGVWTGPQDEFRYGEPNGRIFTVKPELRFRDWVTGEEKQEDPRDAMGLFCWDLTTTMLRDQYLDMVRTTRQVSCTVKGVDWFLDDEIESTRLPRDYTPTNRYRVKKTVTDYLKNQTQLELVSI